MSTSIYFNVSVCFCEIPAVEKSVVYTFRKFITVSYEFRMNKEIKNKNKKVIVCIWTTFIKNKKK